MSLGASISNEEQQNADAPEKDTKSPPEGTQQQPRQLLSQHVADEMAMEQLEEAKRAGLPTEKMLGVMARFAQYCVQTDQMPKTINTTAKAIMVFQAGRELGIPPIKALNSFYFVNNKLSMYGPTVVERIRHWARIEYGECNDKTATVTITRKDDGTSLSSTVTMADLDARGLTKTTTGKKDTFLKHARTMLIYKAVGEIVRHIVPEAVGAFSVEGDYAADADSEISLSKGNGTERKGKVYNQEPEEEPAEEMAEIPTVAQVYRNYDIKVIMNRLDELGIDFKDTATKQELASMLVEALQANQTISHDQENEEESGS